MSDAAVPSPVADAIAATPPPAAPATQAEMIARAVYDQEVANHVRERNLYKPAQQMLNGIDDESRDALLSIADMIRRGDADGIRDWALDTAANVSGGDLAAAIAARQRAGTQAPPAAAAPAAGMDQAAIAALIAETVGKLVPELTAEQKRIESGRQAVGAVFTAAGYDMDDPEGATIINYCMREQKSPQEGIAWYTGVLAQRAAARAAGAVDAATGLALPQVAPAGVAAGGAEATMTDRQRAESRLKRLNAGV